MIYPALKYGRSFPHPPPCNTLCFAVLISSVYPFQFISEEFPNRDSIKSKVNTRYAKQNASEKDKVCSLKIGCSRERC